MIETIDKVDARTERRRKAVGEIVDSVNDKGLPGLFTAVGKMIGDDQPSIDCLRQADADFASASTPGDVWGAALGMAACLRAAELEPEIPETEPPPDDPHPDPTPHPFDLKDNVADIILAGLLVRVRDGH